MMAFLTRAHMQPWLPWCLLLAVCAVLQLAGGYPALRLELPPVHCEWVYRIFTCHLVHLTARHWLYNSLALLIIAWIFVRQFHWPVWLMTYCISSLAVSLGLLLFPDDLHSYAGLSGLLHGLFTMGCLLLYPQQARLALVLGMLMLIKLVLEQFFGSLMLPTPGFVVASMAHVYGVIGGLISWLSWISVSALRARRTV
jgi:rhomboid family GlyGly-CTERM serine protease